MLKSNRETNIATTNFFAGGLHVGFCRLDGGKGNPCVGIEMTFKNSPPGVFVLDTREKVEQIISALRRNADLAFGSQAGGPTP